MARKPPAGKRMLIQAANPVRDGLAHSADAQREATALYKRTGRIIKLLTVQGLLDEEYAV